MTTASITPPMVIPRITSLRIKWDSFPSATSCVSFASGPFHSPEICAQSRRGLPDGSASPSTHVRLFHRFGLLGSDQQNRGSYGDRRIRANQYANQKHKSKAVNARSTANIHHQHHDQSRAGGQQRSTQRLIDRVVDDLPRDRA